MKQFILRQKIRHYLSASVFTISLIALSILLKSETPLVDEFKTEASVAAAPSIYDLPISVVASKGKPHKDWNQKHIDEAKKVGVGSLKDTAALHKLIKDEQLISVVSDRGYIVADMTHSYPYLTEDAILTLRKIGASFYEASGDSSAFTVSSLTRTESTQKKLRKRNANASKRESSHTFGVSFDISYIRYNGVREWNYERTKALEGVLATMQKNGEIYVLKERNQSCFHVTVRNKKSS